MISRTAAFPVVKFYNWQLLTSFSRSASTPQCRCPRLLVLGQASGRYVGWPRRFDSSTTWSERWPWSEGDRCDQSPTLIFEYKAKHLQCCDTCHVLRTISWAFAKAIHLILIHPFFLVHLRENSSLYAWQVSRSKSFDSIKVLNDLKSPKGVTHTASFSLQWEALAYRCISIWRRRSNKQGIDDSICHIIL